MHVSPKQFLILAHAVTLAGGDPRPGMARAGLPDLQTMDVAPWRSIAELDTMMRITREATGDPGFGLVVATSMAHSMYGPLVQLSLHAPTLRAILDDICCYGRLLQLNQELSYTVSGRRCTIHFAPPATTADGRRARAEQIMGNVMMMLRYYGVQKTEVEHVHFAHRQPEYSARYAEVFGPFVRFGQPDWEIAITASLLDIGPPAHNPHLYSLAKMQANSELAEVERQDLTSVAVGRLLQHSGTALPTMQQAAQRLGMSPRTLSRKLASECHSYGQLVASHRQATVERLLMQGNIPLKEIAVTLGYASNSSFHRAFRLKAGLTPLQWKQRELEAMVLEDGSSDGCAAS